MKNIFLLPILLLSSSAAAQLSGPPPIPTDYDMYPVNTTTTTVTVGEDTTTPETISSNPSADLNEFPYAPGNTFFDDDPSTPANFPDYPGGQDPALICLSDTLNNSANTFQEIMDQFLVDTTSWFTTSDVLATVSTYHDITSDWAFEHIVDSFSTMMNCYNHSPGTIQQHQVLNGYAIPTGELFPTTCPSCGLYTPVANVTPPPYIGNEDYYAAVSEFRTKVEAIVHNYYLDMNRNTGHINYLRDIYIDYQRRMDLATADLIFDMYWAWWGYNM